jgi:hypothetical protein
MDRAMMTPTHFDCFVAVGVAVLSLGRPERNLQKIVIARQALQLAAPGG